PNTDQLPARERTIERSSVGLKLNSASEVTAPERLRKSCVVRLAAPATRSSKPICCTNRSEGYNKWLQIASKTIAEVECSVGVEDAHEELKGQRMLVLTNRRRTKVHR